MAASGWRCILVDVDFEGLARLEAEIPSKPQATTDALHQFVRADLTDPAQVEGLAAELPRLDALINNAGRSDTSGVPLVDQPRAQLERLLDLNLHAPRRLISLCLPKLRPAARIVNVASGAGLHAIPWRGAYSPSKAGLIALTQALAADRPDLTVNALCPGFVRTELVDALIAAGRLDPAEAVSMIPLGRMASPEEIAYALQFLASPEASCLRGQALSFDGGTSVFGGSRRYAQTILDTLPLNLPLEMAMPDGCGDSPWAALCGSGDEGTTAHANQRAGTQAADSTSPLTCYPAVLDPSPLGIASSDLLHAVHAAATRFSATHKERGCLTLLLPARRGADWTLAADSIAARMLVATLACEWGGRNLRINAVEVSPQSSVASVAPLLRFVAGAGAQYLTGQTITVT
jgi:NAD(P)-dependent dehydrogenase (short-subunit alcohol dehydrogenase family)